LKLDRREILCYNSKYMNPSIKRRIIKCQGAASEEVEDPCAVEKKCVISVRGKELLSLYCTPMMINELVTGLLMTEGVVSSKISPEHITVVHGDDITVDIQIDSDILPEQFTTARCLGGFTLQQRRSFEKIHDDCSLSAEALKNLFGDFQQRSELFKMTGCFHSAALSDGKQILSFAEDIGRHNAVDKVIGDFLLKDISFKAKTMLASCRISSEIILKCSQWGIPVLASRSAPTDLAIEIAGMSGMTLVGFVRGDRMNIYANPERIIL
jgi:FdhD protein